MSLFAHITTPDSIVLAAMFSLGVLTGVALAWIGVQMRSNGRG